MVNIYEILRKENIVERLEMQTNDCRRNNSKIIENENNSSLD